MRVEMQVDQQAGNAFGQAHLASSFLKVSSFPLALSSRDAYLVYLGLSCRVCTCPDDILAYAVLSSRDAYLVCLACTCPDDILAFLGCSSLVAGQDHQERLSVGAQSCYA